MKKSVNIFGICIAAFVALFVMFSLCACNESNRVVAPSDVSSFLYMHSGGSLNTYYHMYFSENRVTLESNDGNGGKTHKKSRKVSDDVIKSINNVVSNAGIKEWNTDFEQREEVVFDAEETFVYIIFVDGTYVEFDSDCIIPDGGWDAVNEVNGLLEGVIK